MKTSIRTMRFSIRRGLLVVLLLGIFFATLKAPHIQFSNASVKRTTSSEGTDSLIFRMQVRNSGFLPIWYRNEPHDALALGSTKNVETGTINESDAKWAPWTILPAGESVWIEECSYGEKQVPGIPIRDWMGRKHVFTNHALTYND